MACDICGETGRPLELLHEHYQTNKIKEACPDCTKIINKHIWDIREMNRKIEHSFTRKFIINLKDKFLKKEKK